LGDADLCVCVPAAEMGRRCGVHDRGVFLSKETKEAIPASDLPRGTLEFFFFFQKLFAYSSQGTDLSPDNQKKDRAFAEQNKIDVYNHLLHPRTKGWELVVEQLRPVMPAVYDVTIGYPDIFPQTEKVLLKKSSFFLQLN
jgi:hypothetical protein